MKTGNAEFWAEHIQLWKRSGLSQVDYCHDNNISASSFSKWKSKLDPSAKSKRYKPKSKYSKFTKLSDQEFEHLMYSFFNGEKIQDTAKRNGISSKTISGVYQTFQDQVISGALIYPHLFFYAGPLLLLGPPPDSWERLEFYKEKFKHRKNQVRDNETPEGSLRNNIEITFRLLVNYFSYDWSLAEAFVFREAGLQLYYGFTYSPEHSTDPNRWDVSLHKKMALENNLVNVFMANMKYWAVDRNATSYFPDEYWSRIFRDKMRRDFDQVWVDQLVHDLQWVLSRSPMKSKKKIRSSYWDEYRPDDSEIEMVKYRLSKPTLV